MTDETPPVVRTTIHPIVYWMSPQEPYESVEQVVTMAHGLAPVTPGFTPAVALPVCYGQYLQGEMENPQFRLMSDELSPTSFEGLAALRGEIEAQGINCWGWSVPRGNTGDNYSEGYKHGQCASQFPHGFLLNTEWGWNGFWTTPTDPGSWDQFASGFWDAIRDSGMSQRLGGSAARIGATFVVDIQSDGVTTGSMLQASTVEFDRAVMDAVGFLMAETYGPDADGSLDPAKDIPWLSDYAVRQGFSGSTAKRVVGIMAPHTDNSMVQQLSDWDTTAKYGGQVWTLSEAARAYGIGPQFPPGVPHVEVPIYDPNRFFPDKE